MKCDILRIMASCLWECLSPRPPDFLISRNFMWCISYLCLRRQMCKTSLCCGCSVAVWWLWWWWWQHLRPWCGVVVLSCEALHQSKMPVVLSWNISNYSAKKIFWCTECVLDKTILTFNQIVKIIGRYVADIFLIDNVYQIPINVMKWKIIFLY